MADKRRKNVQLKMDGVRGYLYGQAKLQIASSQKARPVSPPLAQSMFPSDPSDTADYHHLPREICHLQVQGAGTGVAETPLSGFERSGALDESLVKPGWFGRSTGFQCNGIYLRQRLSAYG